LHLVGRKEDNLLVLVAIDVKKLGKKMFVPLQWRHLYYRTIKKCAIPLSNTRIHTFSTFVPQNPLQQ